MVLPERPGKIEGYVENIYEEGGRNHCVGRK